MKRILFHILILSLFIPNTKASEICWYEPGESPIEHCCGEPQAIGRFFLFYFASNPPYNLTSSELEDDGIEYEDDCGNKSRIADSVTIYCFGSGNDCYMLNLWYSGWRPTGFVQGHTTVTINS